MPRIRALIHARAGRLRRSALLREHLGVVTPTGVFDQTDAIRWLQRTTHHAERILHYGDLVAREMPEAELAPRLVADED